ncbi:SMI1/KNR4 family protein [Priestia flexa]|uniref:SMI1/KNR4 family protein n=1 Tax=Priestia flexa TaxID=86664 RepID=A0ABU4J7N9_9BACI|nr:SMI1/KNR4 family protein [Priestia flexa]MDW8517021.1 SMI1/KNR4 family protein [Priestia flexa]QCS51233.1 SMI1/KNR4 family protein [Priestia flexa]
MDILEYILKFVNEDKKFGYKEMKNGTVLIGCVPEISNEFWMHQIYHPLTKEEIEKLEKETALSFPPSYKKLLTKCNGLFLLEGQMYIYGKAYLQKGMTREEQIYQPYDLREENDDPPFAIPSNLFYFGGTPKTIFVLDEKGHVLELNRRSKRQMNKWNSFEDWIFKVLPI